MDTDKLLCNDTGSSVRRTSLPTASIAITEHAAYPPAPQIASFKRPLHSTTQAMVFIEEQGYYYHPWHFGMTTRSRLYHFIHSFKEYVSRVWAL